LKQALRQWYVKLSATILELGFKKSRADYSLFVHSLGSSFTALSVYVDNILVTSNDPNCIIALKNLLDQKFGIKDVTPQTRKGSKREKDISKVTVDIFFPLFDNSIQINYIKYQYQELS